jgi:two-component system CheB/CheR fusion protein
MVVAIAAELLMPIERLLDSPDPDDGPDVVAKSHLGFPVVGIGASAGGVAALKQLFENLPAKTGMAFVVVVHLSPKHESSLPSILERAAHIPAVEVKELTPIEPDHIYVISPAKQLSMFDGHLAVTDLDATLGPRSSIDLFFRTLAETHQERAIGVILSGSGADGSQGCKRLKELSGVTLVQSRDDAEFDSMPRAAIATGSADFVLAAAEMGQKLVEIWANARRIRLPRPPDDFQVKASPPDTAFAEEEALVSIKALLRERTGHDFTKYKRATVLRRLERRLQVTAMPDLLSYRRFLEDNLPETDSLLQDLLISVTEFFRDRDAFEALERELMTNSPARALDEAVRVWVAGCATGEEAYSVAMLLLDTVGAPVQVFASDIDQRAIQLARAGKYPESIVPDVPPSALPRHFVRTAEGCQVIKSTREVVMFSSHNLLRDPPFGRLHLICCRNVLIYLDREAQAQVLEMFHFALREGGLLFLGKSETPDMAPGLYEPVDKKQRLYRALPRPPRRGIPAFARDAALPAAVPRAEQQEVVHRVQPDAEFEQAVTQLVTPIVLIDAANAMLRVATGASRFLQVAAGIPSTNLSDAVRPELAAQLHATLSRARQLQDGALSRPVSIAVNGVQLQVSISVRPLQHSKGAPIWAVGFDAYGATLAFDANGAGGTDPALDALQTELGEARRALAESATQSALSGEELVASNEELRTINEELRAATEELETSREELQSVNEELSTVNFELRANVEESDKVADDLQNLIASTEIGTVFVDKLMRIKRFTPEAAKLFNLLEIDIGRSLLHLTSRLAYPELEADLKEVIAFTRAIEREVPGADGSCYLVRVLPYRIAAEDYPDGAILSFIDITERRRMEQQLSDSERRMRLVVGSLNDYAIVTFDLDGFIRSWNGGAELLFGFTAHEAMGQPYDILFALEDQAAGAPQGELDAARLNGRVDDERWHLRKDGSPVYCSGVLTALRDDNGLVGYAKVARDATRRKVVEAHRDASLVREREGHARLERHNDLKDEFLAVMSHELKNPLNLIQLNTEVLLLMLPKDAPPNVSRAVQLIQSAVTSQLQIIDDLLDMSRLNTGKLKIEPVRVVVAEALNHILEVARNDARRNRLTVSADITPNLELWVDPVRFEQIMWNLLANAAKFTPPDGSIHITARVDNEYGLLEVIDSGIGLEAVDQLRVFDLFSQMENGNARRHGGLGIGLSLVKRLADTHGGRVTARSPGIGLGTTFSVWLPLYTGIERHQLLRAGSPGLQGARVLLVDDEETIVESLHQILALAGAQVTTASSAEDAARLARDHDYDVLISDIAMPGQDGYWLIKQIRNQSRTKGLAAIAVSGRARKADQSLAREAGFDSFIAKPLQLSALQLEIERLLRGIANAER